MMTKTPDEIKKGLECCTIPVCAECPYDSEPSCVVKNEDALAYIQQLEAELEEEKTHHQHTLECAQQFEEDWVQMKRERDAAVKDIEMNLRCVACRKYFKNGGACSGGVYCIPLEFEWRGLCKENGGIEND